MRRRFVLLAAIALAPVACADLLGADFEHAGRVLPRDPDATSSASDDGTANAGTDAHAARDGARGDGSGEVDGPLDGADTGPPPIVVTLGVEFGCALKAGQVKCWGDNKYGQLGAPSTSTPTPTATAVSLKQPSRLVVAGGFHTCSIGTGGVVECWGMAEYGELGAAGKSICSSDSYQCAETPVVSAVTSPLSMALGHAFSCAFTAGGLWCVGLNRSGQLGRGTVSDSELSLEAVVGTSGVRAVSAGIEHACAVNGNGTVSCWGKNEFGQVGQPAGTHRATASMVSGIAGAIGVAAGLDFSCAWTAAGTISCWGDDSAGQLGNGAAAANAPPVTVSGITSNVTAVAAGGYHACAIVGGHVECWGEGSLGQLGDGQKASSTSPVTVLGLTDVVSLAAAADATCAATRAGVVKCWGSNAGYLLGATSGPDCNGGCSASPITVNVF